MHLSSVAAGLIVAFGIGIVGLYRTSFQLVEGLEAAAFELYHFDSEVIAVFIIGINIAVAVAGKVAVDTGKHVLGLAHIVEILSVIIQDVDTCKGIFVGDQLSASSAV